MSTNASCLLSKSCVTALLALSGRATDACQSALDGVCECLALPACLARWAASLLGAGRRSSIEWLESTERLFGLRSTALGRLCFRLLAVVAVKRVADGDLLGLGSSFTLVCPVGVCMCAVAGCTMRGRGAKLGAMLGFGAGALGIGAVASLAGGGDCGHGSCEGDGVQSDGVGGVYVSEEADRARSNVFLPWRLGGPEGDLG